MKAAVFIITVLSAITYGQKTTTTTPSGWTLVENYDQFDRTHWVFLAVNGVYLDPVAEQPDTLPRLVFNCSDKWGPGLVLDARTIVEVKNGRVDFQSRADWQDDPDRFAGLPGPELKGITILDLSLIKALLGWNRAEPVRTLMIRVPKHSGGTVTMRFEIPDLQDIKTACATVSPVSGL